MSDLPRAKASYIGAPAVFTLELAAMHLLTAFGEDCEHAGIYVVGSCLERPDFRDVDVRMILDDAAFQRLFPTAAIHSAAWEKDPRWAVMVISISTWLRAQTGLPVDFQFQPMTFANERHPKARNAIGWRVVDRPTVPKAGGGE